MGRTFQTLKDYIRKASYLKHLETADSYVDLLCSCRYQRMPEHQHAMPSWTDVY